jgi:hypothetical protein
LIDALTLIGTSHKKADQGIKKLLTLLETLVDEEKVLLHFEKLVQNSQVLHTQGELFFLSLPKEKTAIQFF